MYPEEPEAPSELHVFRRSDYEFPTYLIPRIELDIRLDPKCTIVIARAQLRRNPDVENDDVRELDLRGGAFELRNIKINGRRLAKSRYSFDKSRLRIFDPPEVFTLETEVGLKPRHPTGVRGLIWTGNVFFTHCEPFGFSDLTFFLDRPDVLATYKVRVEALDDICPAILSNGLKTFDNGGDLPPNVQPLSM